MNKREIFNEEETKFLIDNRQGKYVRDIVEMFNKKFDKQTTYNQLRNWYTNHKIVGGPAELFNKEEKQFILDNYKEKWAKEIAELFNKKFNKNITPYQIQTWLHNRGLRMDVFGKLYNEEETEYLKKIIIGNKISCIIDLFKNKFGRELTPNQIIAFKEKYNIASGYDGHFKKGQKPHNYRNLKTERVGYERGTQVTYIKVSKHKWERKQVYLYKKYKGEIPKGYKVIFLDGNRDNFDIDNLEIVSQQELSTMAGANMFYNDKELTKTSMVLAKLKVKAKQYERNGSFNETNNS